MINCVGLGDGMEIFFMSVRGMFILGRGVSEGKQYYGFFM